MKTVVPAILLRDALLACSLTMCDDTMPILNGVQVVRAGDWLTLTSTDRYQLTQATIKVPIPEEASPDDWEVGVARPDVKRLLAVLPKRTERSAWEADLVFEGGLLILHTPDSQVMVTPVKGEYPKVSAIIDRHVVAPAEKVAFNPACMVNLCKMPGRDRNQPVILRMGGLGKPMLSRWGSLDDGVQYLFMLMPITIDEPAEVEDLI